MSSEKPKPTVTVTRPDPVKKDGVVKEQVFIERKAKNLWEARWTFLSDMDKIYFEEAAKDGLSEREFIKWKTKRKGCICPKPEESKPKPSGPLPATSSALVGWRSSRAECNLEGFGPLYVSPRHTMDPPDVPPLPPQNYIILG